MNILVTFERSPIAIYAALAPVYFTNAESNPQYVWYTDEEKVAKLAISIEMVKSS